MRRFIVGTLWLAAFAAIIVSAFWMIAVAMPGRSFHGAPSPLTTRQAAMRDTIHHDVEQLAGQIGERNDVLPDRLSAAAAYIEDSFLRSGLKPARQTFSVAGASCSNIEVEIRGASRPEEIVVIGAHYDSVDESPGADDNATGTAALLALARHFATQRPARTLRFVAFVNEEPPHFQTTEMGSVVYARRCADRKEKIVAMISLESLGYFSDAIGSQSYPPLLSPFYPSQGNFIAFAGNLGSRGLIRRTIKAFRSSATVPSEGAVLPEVIPEIGWSDQWSFWRCGYDALMVTDTAPYRNPNYHTVKDLPTTVDYDRLARVADGLLAVVKSLSSAGLGVAAPTHLSGPESRVQTTLHFDEQPTPIILLRSRLFD